MGGAMDLVSSGSKVVVCMEHVSKSGEPRIIEKCTLPATGINCVSTLITDLVNFNQKNETILTLFTYPSSPITASSYPFLFPSSSPSSPHHLFSYFLPSLSLFFFSPFSRHSSTKLVIFLFPLICVILGCFRIFRWWSDPSRNSFWYYFGRGYQKDWMSIQSSR